MRRTDREIKEFAEIVRVMEECDVVHLALNDTDGVPYVLALNFVPEVEGEQVTLYFHSAARGHKNELMLRDPRAAFEMDCEHQVLYSPEKKYCSFGFASVMGKGRLEKVPDERKTEIMNRLMARYHHSQVPAWNPAALPNTWVYCLNVESLSGKRRKGSL